MAICLIQNFIRTNLYPAVCRACGCLLSSPILAWKGLMSEILHQCISCCLHIFCRYKRFVWKTMFCSIQKVHAHKLSWEILGGWWCIEPPKNWNGFFWIDFDQWPLGEIQWEEILQFISCLSHPWIQMLCLEACFYIPYSAGFFCINSSYGLVV